jgi:hypothetical protein
MKIKFLKDEVKKEVDKKISFIKENSEQLKLKNKKLLDAEIERIKQILNVCDKEYTVYNNENVFNGERLYIETEEENIYTKKYKEKNVLELNNYSLFEIVEETTDDIKNNLKNRLLLSLEDGNNKNKEYLKNTFSSYQELLTKVLKESNKINKIKTDKINVFGKLFEDIELLKKSIFIKDVVIENNWIYVFTNKLSVVVNDDVIIKDRDEYLIKIEYDFYNFKLSDDLPLPRIMNLSSKKINETRWPQSICVSRDGYMCSGTVTRDMLNESIKKNSLKCLVMTVIDFLIKPDSSNPHIDPLLFRDLYIPFENKVSLDTILNFDFNKLFNTK